MSVCVIIKEMFEICFIKNCSDLYITSVFKVYLVANDLQMINRGVDYRTFNNL